MEDQGSDCPCKKQRVSSTQHRGGGNNLTLDQSEGEETNVRPRNEMPNSEPENEDDGISMCGRGLLDCLTEASNLGGSTCAEADKGEEASHPVFAEKSEVRQPCATQRVRHDIARVVQDTMAALAENNYIRNREAGMQAIRDRESGMQALRDRELGMQALRNREAGMQAIRDRESGMHALRDREMGIHALRDREMGMHALRDREMGMHALRDREMGMQALGVRDTEMQAIRDREIGLQADGDRDVGMQAAEERETEMQVSRDKETEVQVMNFNYSSVKGERTSLLRNISFDSSESTIEVPNTEDENCSNTPFPLLFSTHVDSGEEIMESCNKSEMAYKRKTVCGIDAVIDVDLKSSSHSDVDEMLPARSVPRTNEIDNEPLVPQYIDNDSDQDGDELDHTEFLTDSGFIDLFSNCRNLSSGQVCQTVGGDCSQRESENKDGYSCMANAEGDASAITKDAASMSTDAPSSGDMKIKSLILDNIFKYIPCGGGGAGGTVKREAICRPSNSRFNLDAKFVNEVVSQNNINSLPPQILVHIFRYLSIFTLLRKVSLVCKYWYNWCRDQDLWKNINLMNQHKLTDVHLQQLISFSDRVTSVNLTDCRFVTNVGIRILLARCTHIQVLKLMRCFDVTDEGFKEICDKKLCSQLRCLRLDGCCKLNDATIVRVAKACPLLQILHINQCTKITDHSIKVLADHCPRLTQLLMDHCSQVTEEGIEAIVQGCPYMTYLNIMSCGVTDRGVKLLANLKHLTNLDLSNIPRLTPDAVVYLSRHCKNLECINISLNSVMNDHCVTELARNLPKLKRLYCVSCNISDAGMEKIAEFRPTLEALDVGWCQDITDHGVCVISDACPHLDYFGLIRCDQVTVETVEQLVLKYPRVNYSTFVLESRRLLERAQREGFMFGVPVN